MPHDTADYVVGVLTRLATVTDYWAAVAQARDGTDRDCCTRCGCLCLPYERCPGCSARTCPPPPPPVVRRPTSGPCPDCVAENVDPPRPVRSCGVCGMHYSRRWRLGETLTR